MADSDDAGGAWVVPPSRYVEARLPIFPGICALISLYVPMKDGVRLALDVLLPEAALGQITPQGFATIVLFTPYGRRWETSGPGVEPSPNTAVYRDLFVRRGYALVVVDIRGTGASFGFRDSLRSPKEREDTATVCDWIARQPWSNGIIGSTGISYLGASAVFLAGTGHPAVKAIAPLFTVSDMHGEQLFPGGVTGRVSGGAYDELMQALDLNDRARRAPFAYFGDPRLVRPLPVDEDTDGAMVEAAILEHRANVRLRDLIPELQFRDEGPLNDPALTSDVCSPFTYLRDGATKGLPIYSISGWYDGGGYANGSISRFLTMRGPHDRLLLGPWDHGARTNVSPWRDQPAPRFPVLGEVLRFFDTHLLGMKTGLEDEAPVHWFNIHGERWIGAKHWSMPEASAVWLGAGGTLGETNGPESHIDMPIDVASDTGRHTRWERMGAAAVDNYYDDWAERSAGHLAFDAAPCEEDIELSGHAVADLWIASSHKDAGVFVYLSEVETDGTVRYITEGMLRALHRKLAEPPPSYCTAWPWRDMKRASAELLEPGVPARLVFALIPISWTLKAGSRLRFSIAGADAEHFFVVPNGGAVSLRIYLGGEHASKVMLPMR